MQVKSGPYIVEDGQRDEKTDILKIPGDSFCCNVERFQSVQPLSIKKDISLRRLIDPGDHIEDLGLTGSVGSDSPYQLFFFFQAEDGIRDHCVTGVQTCALPI